MDPSLVGLSAAVHSKVICCTKYQAMVLFEQHPYCARRRSRASGYRRPCCSRVWSASREATLPSFFRAGCRLYRSRTVCISAGALISTVDSFSFLILAFVCHAYPAFVCTPSSFPPKTLKVCSSVLGFVFRFCFSPFVRALIVGLKKNK